MTANWRAYLPRLLVLTALALFGGAGIAEAEPGGTTPFANRLDRDVTVHRNIARTASRDFTARSRPDGFAHHSAFPVRVINIRQ